MTNPQAYPCLDNSGCGLSMRDPGMTLLDYFAGQALAGMLTSPHNDDATPEMYARASYDVARAMLKERPNHD